MTLRVADMPPVYRKWLDGVEPAWTVLEAERVDALLAEPPFEDGAICLAIDLTDNFVRDYWRRKNMQTMDAKPTGIFDEF